MNNSVQILILSILSYHNKKYKFYVLLIYTMNLKCENELQPNPYDKIIMIRLTCILWKIIIKSLLVFIIFIWGKFIVMFIMKCKVSILKY